MASDKSANQLWSCLANFSFDLSTPNQISNGFLAHLFFNQHHKKYPETILGIQQLCGRSLKKNTIRSKLVTLHKFITSKLKCLTKGNTWENLFCELNKMYDLPFDEAPIQPSTSNSEATITVPPVQTIPKPSVKVLRKDCMKCYQLRVKMACMQKKALEVKDQLAVQKVLFESKRKDDVQKLSEKALSIKTMKKQLVRKKIIEKGLRGKHCMLKSQVTGLARKVGRSKSHHDSSLEIKKLKIKIASLEKQKSKKSKEVEQLGLENMALKREIKELRDANDILICQLNDEGEDVEEEIKNKKEYDINMRKATYKALLAQCPVAQVGSLIKAVANEIGGTNLTKAPSKSTAARMAHELSVLSAVQTVECVLQTKVATISWDATTELGHHINEVHIRLADQSTHTLSIDRLPGGKAEDYSSHVVQAIDEMCQTYAEFTGTVFAFIRGQVLSKILSSLTDRAVVNHAACRLINLELGLELIEMNCNLHVLDGFANQVRSALKEEDARKGLDGGKYCMASKVIYMISKLRYKNTGDPAGFKAFVRVNRIPSGMFVRYVGNRLHVMFHMGGVIFHYLPELMRYLKENCKSDFVRNSLISHLSQEQLIRQMQAIGLVGKLITGPWMRFVYKNEQELSNLQMSGHFRTALSMTEAWRRNPSEMVQSRRDVFQQCVAHDPVIDSLRSPDSADVYDVLKVILPCIEDVIKRQLSRYLSGDLSSPSSDMLHKTVSAAPHNIWAERVVGMTCQLWKRCPMATAGFLDSKIKAKTNKTLEWLDKKDDEEQFRLVNFARQRAGVLRKIRKEREEGVDREIEKRMGEVAQKRSMKSRKLVEKDVKKAYDERDVAADTFKTIKGPQMERLRQLIEKDAGIVGALFEHTWYDEESREDCTWNARILKVKEKRGLVVVSYWKQEEIETESEDFDVKVLELMCDMVLGDVCFC